MVTFFWAQNFDKNVQNEEPIQYLSSAELVQEKEKIFVLKGV